MELKLPELFVTKMKELLGEEYIAYEEGFYEKALGGLRVNTLKISTEEFKEISPYEIERIPFIKNGFYYKEDVHPARHPFYHAGLYYLQEPSAMTPASLLPITPGDFVLDLCAAPGGKSTELAARLCGQGVLVTNDISNSRAKALLKNIELFGVRNAIVTSESPEKLERNFTGYFDKILVDAPCSGEGMFRKMPSMMKTWEEQGVTYYSELQKDIIQSAVRMLKPGGYLLYSTCTFSPEENEGTIQHVLDHVKEMEVIAAIPSLEQNRKNDVSYEGFEQGKPEWIASGDVSLQNCVRIWPHKIAGEGHFIALLHKKKSEEVVYPASNMDEKKKNKKVSISPEAMDFFSHLNIDLEEEQMEVIENRIYLLPKGLRSLKGLRILRSGLLLGEMKKQRFEPDQALASALKMEQFDNCYNLSSDDMDVIRYLKGESIELKMQCKDGWVLVCVNGHPLGFGKNSKGTLKNKYQVGWRWM